MSSIVKVVGKKSFITVRQDLTLLELLELQEIEINYQCRDGFCGSCQVKLLDGEVEYINDPIAFVSAGRILPCCCCLKSNIEIELID